MKKLYGVGVGPGDPDLITLKGVKLIQGAAIIFAPKSKTESLAGEIASRFLDGKPVVEIHFPMGEDNQERYVKTAAIIDSRLKEGEYGVFLTLGDPLIYSTFIYVMAEAIKLGLKVETVPGITSFAAAASLILEPVTLRNQSFYLTDGTLDKEILSKVDSVCILKTSGNKEETLDKLEAHGFNYTYIKRCTWEGEQVLTDRKAILEEDDYLSLILAKRR